MGLLRFIYTVLLILLVGSLDNLLILADSELVESFKLLVFSDFRKCDEGDTTIHSYTINSGHASFLLGASSPEKLPRLGCRYQYTVSVCVCVNVCVPCVCV